MIFVCLAIGLNLRGLNNLVNECIRKASSPRIKRKRSGPKISIIEMLGKTATKVTLRDAILMMPT